MTKPGDSMEERRRWETGANLVLNYLEKKGKAESWPWFNWTVDTDAAAVVGKVGTREGWDLLLGWLTRLADTGDELHLAVRLDFEKDDVAIMFTADFMPRP